MSETPTYAAYRKIVAALNEGGLDEKQRFSLAGSVMTQVIEEMVGDVAFKHRAVDEFAKTTHALIDKNGRPGP
jgi:hypothetical protein